MGWGSSTRRGGGRKVRALPRKLVFLGFRREESGMSLEFCQDVQDPCGCSKGLCKKVRAHLSFPIGCAKDTFWELVDPVVADPETHKTQLRKITTRESIFSTSPRATTRTQTDIRCNILTALVLSLFCLAKWKRCFGCGI